MSFPMIDLLVFDPGDFFSAWYGILTLIVLYSTAFFVFAALGYKAFFKNFFDFLFGLIASVVTLPLSLAIIIVSGVHIIKTNEYPSVFTTRYVAGKNGRKVALHTFTVTANLTGEATALGGLLRRTGLEKLPVVYDLMLLKTSFVGVKPLSLTDEKFVSEEQYGRFDAKNGIFNPVVIYDGEKGDNATYEDMFDSDASYASKIGLFTDIRVLAATFLRRVRGEKDNLLGEAAEKEYCEALLERGEIDREVYDLARAESAEEDAESEEEDESENKYEDDEEE